MLPLHRETADRVVATCAADARIAGVAAGGSWLTEMDEYSDLDLVIAVYPEHERAVSAERQTLAARVGPLLSAFTGEHVGEPRLLICLYGPPLVHVDLKFVALTDLAKRVEEPAILWQRDDELARALANGVARYPVPDRQWIEDRFWAWIYYGGTKLGRGELLEAIAVVDYLRARVLGPLALLRAGQRPSGVRRLEQLAPADATAIAATVCAYDRADCGRALRTAITLYRQLRDDGPALRRSIVEPHAVTYLDAVLG